jgi:hypothetical protein
MAGIVGGEGRIGHHHGVAIGPVPAGVMIDIALLLHNINYSMHQ